MAAWLGVVFVSGLSPLRFEGVQTKSSVAVLNHNQLDARRHVDGNLQSGRHGDSRRRTNKETDRGRQGPGSGWNACVSRAN